MVSSGDRALPHVASVAICQRANGRWNSTMRQRFGRHLLFFAGAIATALVLLALAQGATVLAWGSWLYLALPIFTWLCREGEKQRESAAAAQKLADRAERLWKRLLTGATAAAVTPEMRELQNDIFDQRKRDQQIFSWVYARYRSDDEASMQTVAELLADEYRRTSEAVRGGMA